MLLNHGVLMVSRTDIFYVRNPIFSLLSACIRGNSAIWPVIGMALISLLLLSGCTSTTQSEWSCPLPDSENCLDVEHSDKLALRHLQARNLQDDKKLPDTAVVRITRQPETASGSVVAGNAVKQASEQTGTETPKITVGGLFSAVIGGVALSVNSISDGLSSEPSPDEARPATSPVQDTGGLSLFSRGGENDIDAVIARENAILDAETTPSYVSEEQADLQESEGDLPLSSTPTPSSPQNTEEILVSETLSQALSGSSRNRLDIEPVSETEANPDPDNNSVADTGEGAAEQIFIEQLPQTGASARMVRIPEELGEVWIGPYEANGFYYAGSYVFIQTRPPRWQVR